ncbi:hypothetical protein ANCCAN_06307 [Ancylostoma caninum]|uniref:Uncharacterized protein n=1 Tax=Ancylostoma caninum TaxID=29170 RepID=A0A368GTE0_ANCCA|nr:hypothetical protein ANCCAN_06307 [Ancylostoma caninum]
MGRDQQNVEQLLRSNPLLRNLAMFSEKTGAQRDESNSQRRYPLKVFPKDLNKTNYKPTDNNFDNDYERVNETFFQEVEIADNNIRRLPTGRSLSSTDGSDPSDSDVPEESDNDEPFAVTESLIRSLESVDTEVTIPARLEKIEMVASLEHPQLVILNATSDVSDFSSSFTPEEASQSTKSATASGQTSETTRSMDTQRSNFTSTEELTSTLTIPTKKKNETILGLNKSQFQGYLYLKETEDLRGSRMDEKSGEELFSRLARPDQGSENGQLPLVGEKFHQHDVIVVPRERGGYVVSGTRYYVDNRIEGDVRSDTDVMQDHYKLRDSTKEYIEMKEVLITLALCLCVHHYVVGSLVPTQDNLCRPLAHHIRTRCCLSPARTEERKARNAVSIICSYGS